MPAVDSACNVKRERNSVKEPFLPAFLRTISKRSPKIFRVASNSISATENSHMKRTCSPQLTSVKGIDENNTIIANSTPGTPKIQKEGTGMFCFGLNMVQGLTSKSIK